MYDMENEIRRCAIGYTEPEQDIVRISITNICNALHTAGYRHEGEVRGMIEDYEVKFEKDIGTLITLDMFNKIKDFLSRYTIKI